MARDFQQILLVEDDDEDVRLLRIAFDELDAAYELQVAHSLKEASAFIKAVEKSRKPVPDVALLDIQLQDGDGIEVLRRIRAASEMGHVPCIMLTSSNHPVDVADARDAGATQYIVKPMDPASAVSLAQQVHQLWLDVRTRPVPRRHE